ncbi:IS3 family transposase [Streptomyces sp. NPDC091219]|uniref:IS3 family transposase n=1 Tax=Streptomyces sp. NPDC091219 TaxID=3155193 RepID=UPI00344BBBBF
MISRFQFVDDHRDTYEVKRLCQALDVNRSSYYKWLAGAEARATRQQKDRVLAEEIRAVHGESGGAYGSPRITAELREKGRRVNEEWVARIMRTFSITGIRLRRRVRTTVPDPAASPVADLFQRDFTAADPGRKYMGDITYLPLAGGEFLYLATVLDCFTARSSAGPSPAACAPAWSPTRCGWQPRPAAVWTAPCSTPTTGLPGLRRPLRPVRGHLRSPRDQ